MEYLVAAIVVFVISYTLGVVGDYLLSKFEKRFLTSSDGK